MLPESSVILYYTLYITTSDGNFRYFPEIVTIGTGTGTLHFHHNYCYHVLVYEVLHSTLEIPGI